MDKVIPFNTPPTVCSFCKKQIPLDATYFKGQHGACMCLTCLAKAKDILQKDEANGNNN